MLLGFVVAKLLDTLLSKLLAKSRDSGSPDGGCRPELPLSRVGIQVSVSTLIGKIAYWFVLLVFLVSAGR